MASSKHKLSNSNNNNNNNNTNSDINTEKLHSDEINNNNKVVGTNDNNFVKDKTSAL